MEEQAASASTEELATPSTSPPQSASASTEELANPSTSEEAFQEDDVLAVKFDAKLQ